jgi:DNA-binding response OmpR family regulator
MQTRILLVEDNARLSGLLSEALRGAGYQVDATGRGADFRRLAAQNSCSMYVIDLGLPDGDGVDLIASRRSNGDETPILVITARAGIDDHVSGLDCGADDYLVKPFEQEILLARVRALLRRPRPASSKTARCGHLVLDLANEQVNFGGALFALRPVERRLLCVLARRLGKMVAREALEGALYDCDKEVSPNAVEQAISRLRGALGRVDTGLSIRTVWGSGYVLEATT